MSWTVGALSFPEGCITDIEFVGGASNVAELVGRNPDGPHILVGNHVFFVIDGTSFDESAQLISMDVSDKTAPFVADILSDPPYVNDGSWVQRFNDVRYCFLHDGNYLYIGNGDDAWFSIVDISDPTNMTLVGSVLSTDGFAILGQMHKYGNYVIGTDWSAAAVFAIDVSNPAAPFYASFYTNYSSTGPPGEAFFDNEYAWPFEDGFAYGTSYSQGFIIIVDCRNPTNIQSASVLNLRSVLWGSYCDVVKRGNVLYTTGDDSDSFVTVDVTDPFNPFLLDSIVDARLDGIIGPLLLVGDFAVVSGKVGFNSALTVIDVSNPANISIVHQFSTTLTHSVFSNWQLSADGKYILMPGYVPATGAAFMQAIDVSDPDPTNWFLEDTAAGVGGTGRRDYQYFAFDGSYIYAQTGSFNGGGFDIFSVCR